jgi:hypothetical protein
MMNACRHSYCYPNYRCQMITYSSYPYSMPVLPDPVLLSGGGGVGGEGYSSGGEYILPLPHAPLDPISESVLLSGGGGGEYAREPYAQDPFTRDLYERRKAHTLAVRQILENASSRHLTDAERESAEFHMKSARDIDRVLEQMYPVEEFDNDPGGLGPTGPLARARKLHEDKLYYNDAEVTVAQELYKAQKQADEEASLYFEITGRSKAHWKHWGYEEWREEYIATGMSVPFEKMVGKVTAGTYPPVVIRGKTTPDHRLLLPVRGLVNAWSLVRDNPLLIFPVFGVTLVLLAIILAIL